MPEVGKYSSGRVPVDTWVAVHTLAEAESRLPVVEVGERIAEAAEAGDIVEVEAD